MKIWLEVRTLHADKLLEEHTSWGGNDDDDDEGGDEGGEGSEGDGGNGEGDEHKNNF